MTVKRRVIDKKRAIIVDIDGTIALHGPGRNDRPHYDYSKVIDDMPDTFNITLIRDIAAVRFAKILLVSGRNVSCSQATQDWLDQHFGAREALFMRPDTDEWRKRPDTELKKWLYETNIEPYYDVVLVFDDRTRVVKMWRDLGLRVYQVAEGDF